MMTLLPELHNWPLQVFRCAMPRPSISILENLFLDTRSTIWSRGFLISAGMLPWQLLLSSSKLQPEGQVQQQEPGLFTHSCWHRNSEKLHSSMSAVVKQSFVSKEQSCRQVAIQTTCPLPQLEAGILQLPRTLQQPDKMLYNKFLVKHFFPKETRAAAEHNVWLLFIYFSFLIPVTSWSCFLFCFTSETEIL